MSSSPPPTAAWSCSSAAAAPPPLRVRISPHMTSSSLIFSRISSFTASRFSASQSWPSIHAVRTARRSSSLTASPAVPSAMSRREKRYTSKAVLASAISTASRSSSASSSASWIIVSIRSALTRPCSATERTSLEPLLVSSAVTVRIAFSSTLKVTSICEVPRCAGKMPPSLNLPRRWLLLVSSRSPSKTLMSKAGWLSRCVVTVVEFLAGSGVFLAISGVMMPPTVSMPSVNGVTSSKSGGPLAPKAPELNAAAWIAAPWATTSSGLMLRANSLPSKNSCTSCRIFGMRVEPPTSRTSSTSDFFKPASFKAWSMRLMVRLNKSMFNSSNRARVNEPDSSRPPSKASKEKRTCGVLLNCRFNRSASRRSLASASALETGLPCFFSNALAK
mmetsp:Transcript_80728/g.233462  ORF Transcript_80728/g.233462 Transcript_80728/m.233462 type:complete len:390 (+) Transcript_80728:69-1238(+)